MYTYMLVSATLGPYLYRVFPALQYFMANVWHVKCHLAVISADTILYENNGNYDYFNIFYALNLGPALPPLNTVFYSFCTEIINAISGRQLCTDNDILNVACRLSLF